MSFTGEKRVLKVKAIIFDMDGVITDTMPYHYQAWKTAFQEVVHKDIAEQDIYLREGSKGAFALKEIFQQYGWPCDPKILESLLKRKEEIFPAIVKTVFIDGAVDFIECAHAAGFLLALVTGTSRDELVRMLPDDLQKMFTVTITGSDVTHGKPHAEPYLTALVELGIGAPDAVVLENAPLGIQSAKSAGLTCIALATSLDEEFLSNADFIFPSYAKLCCSIEVVLTQE